MGIMGWSYGGFLTAWTISHSNRFRAASIGAGPVDLFTMYGATDIPEFMETYFGGSPWSAQRVYFEHSPMTYAKNIKTPTMIQHGGDDRTRADCGELRALPSVEGIRAGVRDDPVSKLLA